MQGFFMDSRIIFVINSIKTKRLDILTKACMVVSWYYVAIIFSKADG